MRPLQLRSLTKEERVQLEAKIRRKTLPVRLHQRYRIVLEASRGYVAGGIAERVGCSRDSVWRWVRRFNESGFTTFEAVAIEVDTSLSGVRVARVLDQVIARRGAAPREIVLDNGPELTSWLARSRFVHRTRPAGGSLHARAMRYASWRPSSRRALRCSSGPWGSPSGGPATSSTP